MKRTLLTCLLVLSIVAHSVINGLWLARDGAPLAWDQAGHTRIALEFASYLRGQVPPPRPFLEISSYYPPLTHILMAIPLIVLGYNQALVALPITFYFVGTVLGVYLLTKALTKQPMAAVIAAVLFSFFPIVYSVSRSFLLEIPLLFWLILCWYFLYQSKAGENTKYTFFAVVTAAAVAMTKWVGLIYLVVPAVFVLPQFFKHRLTEQKVTRLFLALMLGLSLVMPWYVVNGQHLLESAQVFSKGEASDPQILLSTLNIMYYLAAFINFQVTLIGFLVIAPFVGFYLLAKKAPYKLLFMVFMTSMYVVFTFISNKDIRYTVPMLVPIAMTVGWGVSQLLSKRKVLTTIWCLVGFTYFVTQCVVTSFGIGPSVVKAVKLPLLGWIDYINTSNLVIKKPQQDLSPNEGIVEYLLTKKKPDTLTKVVVGIDQQYTNQANLDLAFRARNEWTFVLQTPYDISSFKNENEIRDFLSGYQYLVIPTGEVGVEATRHAEALKQIRNYVIAHRGVTYSELKWFKAGFTPGEVLIFEHTK